MNRLRFWMIAVLLAGTTVLLRARGATDRIPVSEPLSLVPQAISGWTGSDVEIDQETRDVLGPGDFLSRVYTRAEGSPTIGLFIAYFPSQRTGATIHSPKNCLPGSGWIFESSKYVTLTDIDHKPHRVGEYIVSDGENRQFVIYWYQAHGRSVANEYLARMYMVKDAVEMGRTDGALVRVTTPIGPIENVAQAKNRVEAFTARLAPMLPSFVPN